MAGKKPKNLCVLYPWLCPPRLTGQAAGAVPIPVPPAPPLLPLDRLFLSDEDSLALDALTQIVNEVGHPTSEQLLQAAQIVFENNRPDLALQFVNTVIGAADVEEVNVSANALVQAIELRGEIHDFSGAAELARLDRGVGSRLRRQFGLERA